MKAKKMLCFFALVLWAIGVIGSIGYALYLHQYVIAVGVVVAGLFGIPTVKNYWKFLNE